MLNKKENRRSVWCVYGLHSEADVVVDGIWLLTSLSRKLHGFTYTIFYCNTLD